MCGILQPLCGIIQPSCEMQKYLTLNAFKKHTKVKNKDEELRPRVRIKNGEKEKGGKIKIACSDY